MKAIHFPIKVFLTLTAVALPLLASATSEPVPYYPEVILVNSRNLRASVTPAHFLQGRWSYVITWNRGQKKPGSIKLRQGLKTVALDQASFTALPGGAISVTTGYVLKPGVRYNIEFYSQPKGKGALLARKYFLIKPAPKDYAIVCPADVMLCPDGKTYVSRQSPACEFAPCPVVACQNLWWYDGSSSVCAQKEFCGAYSYESLRTFETEAACKDSLSTRPSALKVLTPNGGEVWAVGSTKQITWTLGEAGSNTEVAIELFPQNPAPVSEQKYSLAFSVPNTGFFDWKVGFDRGGKSIPAGTYKIHIQQIIYCVKAPCVSNNKDSSDGSFTLTDPTLTGQNFRYLKVKVSGNSRAAIKELEVYDSKGNKYSPASASVSADWVYPSYGAVGAQGAYDGDLNTEWNSGDFDAWYILDLGEAKTSAKVKLMPSVNPNGARQTYTLSISSDGADYILLAAFPWPILNNVWLERGY